MYFISSLLCGLRTAGRRLWLVLCFSIGMSMVPTAIVVDAFIDCAIWCDGRLCSLHRSRQPIAVCITILIWLLAVLRLVRPSRTGLCVCVCRHPMWSPEVSECARLHAEHLDILETIFVLTDACLIALECLAYMGLRVFTVVCVHVFSCVVSVVILALGSRYL